METEESNKPISVIITVDAPKNIEDVLTELNKLKFKQSSVLYGIGIIFGETTELFEIIENVSGVLSVDINEEVSIDPTGVNADKCRAK